MGDPRMRSGIIVCINIHCHQMVVVKHVTNWPSFGDDITGVYID